MQKIYMPSASWCDVNPTTGEFRPIGSFTATLDTVGAQLQFDNITGPWTQYWNPSNPYANQFYLQSWDGDNNHGIDELTSTYIGAQWEIDSSGNRTGNILEFYRGFNPLSSEGYNGVRNIPDVNSFFQYGPPPPPQPIEVNLTYTFTNSTGYNLANLTESRFTFRSIPVNNAPEQLQLQVYDTDGTLVTVTANKSVNTFTQARFDARPRLPNIDTSSSSYAKYSITMIHPQIEESNYWTSGLYVKYSKSVPGGRYFLLEGVLRTNQGGPWNAQGNGFILSLAQYGEFYYEFVKDAAYERVMTYRNGYFGVNIKLQFIARFTNPVDPGPLDQSLFDGNRVNSMLFIGPLTFHQDLMGFSGTCNAAGNLSFKWGVDNIGSVTTDDNGNFDFTAAVSFEDGGTLTITPSNLGGTYPNIVKVLTDLIPPPMPDYVVFTTTTVYGRGEAGTTVYIKRGVSVVASGVVDVSGDFAINVSALSNGESLKLHAVDGAGNLSPENTVIVNIISQPDITTTPAVSLSYTVGYTTIAGVVAI